MNASIKKLVSDRIDESERLASGAISRSQADKKLAAAVECLAEAMRLAHGLTPAAREAAPAPMNPIDAAAALDFPDQA